MCESSSLITLFVGKNFVTFPRIRRGKITSEKILVTGPKFRHFYPTNFSSIRYALKLNGQPITACVRAIKLKKTIVDVTFEMNAVSHVI